MTEEESREAFEAACKKLGLPFGKYIAERDFYMGEGTDDTYKLWQACTEYHKEIIERLEAEVKRLKTKTILCGNCGETYTNLTGHQCKNPPYPFCLPDIQEDGE